MKTLLSTFSLVFFFFALYSKAANPEVSKYLKNLSASLNTEAIDDVAPEIVVQGNTVHVVWIEDKYGAQNPLYYCRSTDLGKTWDTPILIARLIDKQYATQPATRKLAVDGSNVHIAYCDYNWSENGTGRIYYFRSVNNGSTFEPEKIVATTGGGYKAISRSSVKAANGKVAIAYVGDGAKIGVWVLHSDNGGSTFTDKQVFTEGNDLADFYFDGNQIIILHNYAYYYYGLNVGRVYVTVSNDNGTTAKTNKVSVTFLADQTEMEKCLARHDYHYAKKIAKSGNNIHVVFEGQTESTAWTVLYARSTDNGVTFEKAMDINNGTIPNIQGGQENIAAKNGNVYISYLSTGNPVYFLYSNDNGTKFSTPERITPDGVSHSSGSWWIGLVTDPNDETGKSVFLTGNAMFSAKSTDGGKSFSKFNIAVPFMKSILTEIKADLAIDSNGGMHWIAENKFRTGTDKDIFYRNITAQPAPGEINEALVIENQKSNYETELVVVPSAPSLDFDSAMTAEAWVKFYPGTEESVSIFAKVNGYDGADYSPSGYNLGFRRQGGTEKMCINAAIKTDKGDFINWGDCSIDDTLWHHVAITYDAKAGLNNFKTYVDGIVMTQQTVTGTVVKNNGMLMIGARTAFASWYYYTKYAIDELRLWGRALTQQELLANQTKKFTGTEDHLRLYLNFDNTFKDLSGNGNDAIPVYNGTLLKSNFDPPVPAFDIFQANRQVSFNNNTANGKSYLWNFGDGKTSDKGNPVYTYTNPGEYNVFLQAANNNSITAAMNTVSIIGLDKVEPGIAGNYGSTSFKIFGGNIDNTTLFWLKKGDVLIPADTVVVQQKGVVNARFDLTSSTVGNYTLVAKISGQNYFLDDAIKIEQAKVADPYIYVHGRNTVLFNWWHTKTIEFGNDGNVDIYNVPLFIAISDLPGIEIEFINVTFQANQFSKVLGHQEMLDSIPLSFKRENFFPNGEGAIIFPVIIPCLAQGIPQSLMLRVKSPSNYQLDTWIYAINTSSDLKSGDIKTKNLNLFGDCLKDAITGTLYTAAGTAASLALSSLPVGCVKQTFDTAYGTASNIYKGEDGKTVFWSGLWDFASLAVNCAVDLFPPAKAYQAALTIAGGLMDLYSTAQSYYECSKYIRHSNKVFTVSSFDPNEIVGPAGFGPENYIQKNKQVPYTIFFENKSTATAPAHVVTVKDTLDLTKFDLAEFGFGSFGWGDTIFNVSGSKLREFSRDIDMRPAIDLITRVSGSLDTIKGIVTWEFRSLNPTTLYLEEDPFIGFLPPNSNSPEGEGFVSFSVGLKKELTTNAIIKNRAEIIFDQNEPIITNQYSNKLDTDLPESHIYPLDATTDSRFPIAWTGSDKGSGVAGYTIYVLENDTLLYAWKTKTTTVMDDFEGNVGSRYKFYSVATDNVSLIEKTPDSFDTQTLVTVDVEQFKKDKGNLQVWPNPANDKLNLVFKGAPCGMYVVELMNSGGVAVHSRLYSDSDFYHGVIIDVSEFPSGYYLLRVIFGNKSETRKIMIQ
jgi:PKD repeat protein